MSTANANPGFVPMSRLQPTAPGEPFVLSDAERQAIEHEMTHYPEARAASIEALKIVQHHRGWVPDGASAAIGAVLGIPGSDVEGVATFYNMIFRKPVGRHVVKVCDSIACFLTGYDDLREALIKQLGIGYGQTTADGRFTLLPICCLGLCDKGPAIMIDDVMHGPVEPGGVAAILEPYK